MVVEPGEDFGVGAVSEAVVGDVRLPGFVGLFGLESDVGGAGFLFRFRGDQFGSFDDPIDRGAGQCGLVVVLKVPGDGVSTGVEALGGKGAAQFDNEVDCGLWGVLGAGFGASRAGLERGVAFGAVAGHEDRYPGWGHVVVAGNLGL